MFCFASSISSSASAPAAPLFAEFISISFDGGFCEAVFNGLSGLGAPLWSICPVNRCTGGFINGWPLMYAIKFAIAGIDSSPKALPLKYTGTRGHVLTSGCAKKTYKKRVSYWLRCCRNAGSMFPIYFFFGKVGMPSELPIWRLTMAWNSLSEEYLSFKWKEMSRGPTTFRM